MKQQQQQQHSHAHAHTYIYICMLFEVNCGVAVIVVVNGLDDWTRLFAFRFVFLPETKLRNSFLSSTISRYGFFGPNTATSLGEGIF